MLCRAGVNHAWGVLEKQSKAGLLLQLSPRAKASVKGHLEKTLATITRPAFHLQWASFTLALSSLGFPGAESSPRTIQLFLRDRPAHRLGELFKSFPVLADLWTVTIRQWRSSVTEIAARLRKDRAALAPLFAGKVPPAKIQDLRLGLSDRHKDGRSVALIQFSPGQRVIYKPRSGANESAWFSFLAWMNRLGFRPELRLLWVLARKAYCWMEFAQAAPCTHQAGVRRFYRRLGGLIAAAYLLKAVDCHRENLVAAGEHPILIDVDALWHVSPATRKKSMAEVLSGTGFFPNSRRWSAQSRSSALGPLSRGPHRPRIGDQPVRPAAYANEIISGFSKAWRCVLGEPRARRGFLRRVNRVRALDRRWIYWATANYAAIVRASLQPAALRSGACRDAMMHRFCSSGRVTKALVRAELKALRALDIPYFTRRSREAMPSESSQPPPELLDAIRQALDWA
jgi:lantibiotic modifying enzyme